MIQIPSSLQYCGSSKLHGPHAAYSDDGSFPCKGMIDHEDLIKLYLRSEKEHWDGKYSYHAWRSAVATTMNFLGDI